MRSSAASTRSTARISPWRAFLAASTAESAANASISRPFQDWPAIALRAASSCARHRPFWHYSIIEGRVADIKEAEVREIIHAVSDHRRRRKNCIMRTAAPADLFCLFTRLRATIGGGIALCRPPLRCIRYNTRGYPPSDMPDLVEQYSQRGAVDDALAVLDHLNTRNRTSSAFQWVDSSGRGDP